MSARPALLVAAWTVANLVLAAVLVGFGELGLAIALYFAAAAPAFAFAFAVWRLRGRNPQPAERFALASGTNWIPVIALGLATIGAGLIFGAALIAVGAVVTAGALLLFHRAARGAR